MSGPIEFTQAQSQALVMCLLGSIAWGAALLMLGRMLARNRGGALSERVWITALLIAAAPSLLAPIMAHFGLSIRAQASAASAIGEAAAYVTSPGAPISGSEFVATEVDRPPVTTEQAISLAALIYIYGAVMALMVWAVRSALFSLSIARAWRFDDPKLVDALDEFAVRYGLTQCPPLRRSANVSSVCVYGVARPIIVIPEAIEDRVGRNGLILMCAHELAHVRRGDTRLFTATSLARALFWFNPFVHALAARVELAAEEGADSLVLKAGADRRAYAVCFVEGLKFAASRSQPSFAYAPSFTPQGRDGRKRRLDSILSANGESKMALSTKLLLGAAATTALVAAIAQAAWAVDPEVAAEKRRKAAAQPESGLSVDPVAGEVTLGYRKGYADLSTGEPRTHTGVDIKAAKGAAVVAAGDGVVVEATDRYRDNPNWGKVVVIDHGHGLVTRYAHLDSYDVRKGDRVKAGERIAAVGATGKVTGPHLHFEALRDGKPVEPKLATAPVAPAAPERAPFAQAPETPEPPFELEFNDGEDFVVFDEDAVGPSVALEDGNAVIWANGDLPAGAIATPRTFAFVNGGGPLESGRTFESLLDDILEGRAEGDYKLSLEVDGERLELSGDKELSDEERTKLRAMAKSLRARDHGDRKEMRRAIALAETHRVLADQGRRDILVRVREADEAEWRLEALEAELEAIDATLEELREVQVEMPADFVESIEEALADLEVDRADIVGDTDLDDEDRRQALVALDAAREQLKTERSRQNALLKRQLAELDQEIAKLKQRRAEIIREAKARQ
jgi:murein DD-endopeptidase MepM/ murein hydrolase activator NlpD